jgi:plasmid maintenance system antidote protein VapI
MRRTRGLAVSFLVRRKLAEASVSHTAAAEVLGVSRQRFERLLDEGLLAAGDLLALEDVAGGIVADWLKGRFKVTPERAAGTPRDIMGELGDVMASVGGLVAETTRALADGITHAEAAGIVRGCEAIRREVGELEGAVNAAVVVPPVRGLR